MLKRISAVFALLALSAFAQSSYLRQSLYFYDASNNLEYVCSTASEGTGTTNWTRAATTLTNIVVAANVGTVTTSAAHGLSVGATVVVAGATADEQLNGMYPIATVPTPATFTIATTDVANATYNEGTLAMAHTGPVSTASIWRIERYYYDTNNNLIKTASAIASTAPITSGRVPMNLKCSDRATYIYR